MNPAHRIFVPLVAALALLLCGCGAADKPAPDTQTGPVFSGMSDASAAVIIGEGRIAAADDETNSLRVFNISGGAPLSVVHLAEFLHLDRKNPESDLEAAARVGNRVYWITSHGRSKEGKLVLNRHCFFATEIVSGADGPTLKPVGHVCHNLAQTIAANPEARKIELHTALGLDGDAKRSDLAPKAGGFNIEGLCASPDGATLYIGLRNPRHKPAGSNVAHAVVIPLLNPQQIIDDGKAPELGAPLLWDLGGSGIRDMAYSKTRGTFVIVAGAHDDHTGGALYTWSGQTGVQPEKLKGSDSALTNLQPEALLCFEDSAKMLLLSDDGNVRVPVASSDDCTKEKQYQNGTCPNKFLRDESKRTFRSIWVTP